ncbi:MAG: tetratricopeptide repeat protein [Akkermansiaceae bacterium]
MLRVVKALTRYCFGSVRVFCVAVIMQGQLVAQAPVNPQFDPSDVYFQAYLAVRAAEKLEKDEEFVEALKKYEQATKLFESVKRFYPEWKTAMVKNRQGMTAKAITEVREKAGEQLQKDKGVIAELEGGERVAGELLEPARNVKPLNQGILEVDPLQARRLKEAEAEAARLRQAVADAEAKSLEAKRLAKRLAERATRDAEELRRKSGQNTAEKNSRSNEAMRNASRVGDLQKQNNLLAKRLNAAENKVQSLRAQMAAAPVQSEMKALNDRIERLEQERSAMGMALKTSRGDHAQALAKVEILAADMEILKKKSEELRQKEVNLERDLKKERNVANQVVAGQRKQIQQLENKLVEKSKQLEAANEQISGLREELEESREAYTELREERDGLLQERDQMAALLKLNESGRIEQLIEQNMGLAKNLREANEKVERLNVDNNAAKDQIVDALRDLAIAKSQINRLHQEKREQDKRISELTEKLKNEEIALATGEAQADPAEVEVLREVIRRQLRVQERRRQAKDLLVQAAKDLGQEDEQLGEAIELFDGAEMELTPEEQKLVADQQVDGEFVSPFARDRATVGLATSELNQQLESYDRAATKAYLSGRLLSTRELFEIMVEQHPGHVPALCKLGVVQLKLNEPEKALESFQRAIELDNSNAYANRMLGYSYLKAGDIPSAELFLKRALDMAPNDSKSYLLLGTIAYRLGRLSEAESQFKGAISADPLPSEPYFNLALLHAKEKKMDEARKYYDDALERGAVPDKKLETKLFAN